MNWCSWKALLLGVVLSSVQLSHQTSYDGHKTYRVSGTQAQIKKLIDTRGDGIDFLKEPSVANKEVDVLVSPSAEAEFLEFLDEQNMKYKIVSDDIGSNIEKERKAQLRAGFTRSSSGSGLQLNKFYRYDEFSAYIRQLAKNHPDLCEVETIGHSYEGREVLMLKISSNPRAKKPIFLMEAGMHAREWAGPMTVTYFASQLVENNTATAQHLQDIDWYIIPVANPDGYEYTHTTDRLWRKTRQPYGQCMGADANRNFGFHWAEAGSSDDACTDIFHGPHAFSELESQNIRNTGLKYASRVAIYSAVHSYGSFFLYPWGYAKVLPKDWRKLQMCAEDANTAIESMYGTSYLIGSSARALYEAAGGSDDWFKGVLNVTYTYTVELPGADNEGFILPAAKLPRVVTETFEGFKVMAKCPFNTAYDQLSARRRFHG